MANDAHLNVTVTATTDAYAAAMRSAEAATSQMAAHVTEALGTVMGPLLALGTAVGTGAFFKEAAGAALEYNEGILTLSRQLGLTTEAASTLSTAIRMVGGTSEGYTSAVMKLNMHLRTQETELNQLGMRTRGANGALLDQQTLFQNALQTMLSYREGTDRNQFALYAFGRSASEVTQYLKLNQDVMSQAETVTRAYGLSVGKDAALAAEDFGIQLRTTGLVLDAVKVQVGTQLLPVLANLAAWFGSIAPDVIGAAVTATKGLLTVVETLILAIRDLYNFADLTFRELGALVAGTAATLLTGFTAAFTAIRDAFQSSFSTIVEVMTKLVHGDLTGAWEALKAGAATTAEGVKTNFQIGLDATASVTKASAQEMAQAWQDYSSTVVHYHTAAAQRVEALWTNAGASLKHAMADPVGPGTKTFTSPLSGGQVELWREQLNQIKDAEGSWLDFSKARELAFWEAKVGLARKGSSDYKAVLHEVATLKKAVAKQEYDEGIAQLTLTLSSEQKLGTERIAAAQAIADRMAATYGAQSVQAQQALQRVAAETRAHTQTMRALQDELTQTEAQAATHRIALQEAALQAGVAAGKVSKLEEVAQTRDLEQQRYDLAMQGLVDRKTLDRQTALEQARLDREIEALAQAHQLTLLKLDQEAAAEARTEQQARTTFEAKKATDALSLKEAALQQAVSLGQLSKDEELTQTQELEQEQYQFALQGLMQRQALAGQNVLQAQQVAQQIEVLTAQHQLRMQKLTAQAVQNQRQVYQSLVAPVTGAFDQITIGILRGNQTITQAVRNLAASIVTSYADMVAKMLVHWAFGQMTQTEIQEAETIKRLALQAWEGAESLATQVATAAKKILNYAFEAMAGTEAATSGAGPEVSIPAAAAVFAQVAASIGSLVSAQGGYDVPRDTLARLHANEMVLPADLAGGLRGMIAGGGGGGDIHLHVQAVDAQSVQRLFASNGAVLAAVLHQQMRDQQRIPRGGRPGGGWQG